MFSALLTRWRIRRLFTPDGDHFLYRRNSRAEAFLVSPEERQNFLKIHRKKYWAYNAIMMGGGFLALIVAAAMAVLADLDSEVAPQVIAYTFIAIFMVGYFYLQKRALVLSEAAFANHRPVSPTRNWVEVRKERVKKTSWVRLLVGGAILIGLAVLFYPYKDSTDYYRYGWFGYFGFIAIIWVRSVLLKARLAFGESD